MKIATDETMAALVDLANEVAAASETARQSAYDEQNARHRATAALNALNQAQRALDEHIAKMKAAALRDSDWGRARSAQILTARALS